jgi:hypothetical protein
VNHLTARTSEGTDERIELLHGMPPTSDNTQRQQVAPHPLVTGPADFFPDIDNATTSDIASGLGRGTGEQWSNPALETLSSEKSP